MMRIDRNYSRVMLLAGVGLGLLTSLTACPKRQDGLVFDDSPAMGDKSEKPEKSAKPAKPAKNEPAAKGEKTEKSAKGSKNSRSKGKGTADRGDMMYGRVVDRNDQPLKRVTITVNPGNTELISNKWGEYEVDSLHNEDGSKMTLKKGQDYTINAWKPGFHETTQIFRYDGATAEIPTITLIEDSIKLEQQDSTPMIPAQTNDENGSGAAGKSVENE